MSHNREITVVDSYFYINIYSGSSVMNYVAISLQRLYRTQITQVKARNEFVWKCMILYIIVSLLN